jgi:hypothetical protein
VSTLRWQGKVDTREGITGMGWGRVDDFDGTPARRETFGFLGRAYVLDLGDVSKKKLESALRPFLAVATEYGHLPEPPEDTVPAARAQNNGGPGAADGKATGVKAGSMDGVATAARRRRRDSGPKVVAPEVTDAQIRSWASEHGLEVPARGRLRREVVDAYDAAH